MLTKHQTGLTMIEVMVTIAITTVGLLGLSAMQFQSVQSVQDTGNRSHAIWVVNDVINRMRANEGVDYDTIQTTDCSSPPVRICSAYHNGTTRINANENCSDRDVAASDLWEALCGFPIQGQSTGTFNGSASLISAPTLTIERLNQDDMEITLSWISVVANSNDPQNRKYLIKDGEVASNQRDSYTAVIRP